MHFDILSGTKHDIISHKACKEITCFMNFKKQRPDSPFFFEKEQVISLLRHSDWVIQEAAVWFGSWILISGGTWY